MMFVLRFFMVSGRTLLVWLMALTVSALLLTIMPIVQFIGIHGLQLQETKTFQVSSATQTLPSRPKLPPRESKPQTKTQSSQQGPKAMARSTLAMDLGVGGTGGVAIAAVDVDAGQMVYAEGETDEDAVPLRQVAPQYPDEARKAGISGMVRVLITILEDGSVGEMRFLETPGNYGFEKAVREALSQWRFQPARVGGIPVRQKMEQPFQF